MPEDFRARRLAYRATVDFYLDDGRHTHRGTQEFTTLELAKKWVAKKLDPKLNIDWCICDDAGIELEGN